MSRWTSRGVGAAGAALVLVLGVAGPAAVAVADESGKGHSSGATSLLGIALGDDELLLSLVTEEAMASTDPATSGPSATERVAPLGVASSLVPGLAALSQPTIETHHTTGEDTEITPGIDLTTLVAGGAVPGLLAGAVDPVTLRSAVSANGAESAASGSVRDLSVLGGFARVDLVEAVLSAAALKDSAGADRRVHVDEVVALDLGALLASLGISLGDLPIDTAIDVLGALGVPLPGGVSAGELASDIADLLDDTSAVRSQVADLQGDIDDLQDDLDDLESQHAGATDDLASFTEQLALAQAAFDACLVLCAPLQAIVDAQQAQVDAATATVAALDAAIDATQAQIDALADQIADLLATIADAIEDLGALLDGILEGLDGAALLVLEDIDVHLVARAAGTVATSAAEVEMSVGDVRVGTVSLGAIDLGATLAELAAVNTAVNTALATVLGLVDADLADVVDVQLLDRQTSITPTATGITAAASFAGLRVVVTPPSTCDLLASLAEVENPIETVLDDLGLALPDLPTEVADVLRALGSTVDCTQVVGSVAEALTQPLRVEALSVSGSGFYAVSTASSSPVATLPATGGTAQLPLVLGLGGLGLAAGWLVRRSAGPLVRR